MAKPGAKHKDSPWTIYHLDRLFKENPKKGYQGASRAFLEWQSIPVTSTHLERMRKALPRARERGEVPETEPAPKELRDVLDKYFESRRQAREKSRTELEVQRKLARQLGIDPDIGKVALLGLRGNLKLAVKPLRELMSGSAAVKTEVLLAQGVDSTEQALEAYLKQKKDYDELMVALKCVNALLGIKKEFEES